MMIVARCPFVLTQRLCLSFCSADYSPQCSVFECVLSAGSKWTPEPGEFPIEIAAHCDHLSLSLAQTSA
jgi:hypothetical protein